MARVTRYYVLPILRNEYGDLVPGEAIEVASGSSAMFQASIATFGTDFVGAIAFSRIGATEIGDFDDAVELGRYGETPDDLAL
jgi:hypothetical protein